MTRASFISNSWTLVPFFCAVVAGVGVLANLTVAASGPVSVPMDHIQGLLLYVYFALWGTAPLLLLATGVTAVIRRKTTGWKSDLLRVALCLVFLLCPPLFVL